MVSRDSNLTYGLGINGALARQSILYHWFVVANGAAWIFLSRGKSESINLLTQRFVLKANAENIAQLLTNFWYLITPETQTEPQGRGRAASAVSSQDTTWQGF